MKYNKIEFQKQFLDKIVIGEKILTTRKYKYKHESIYKIWVNGKATNKFIQIKVAQPIRITSNAVIMNKSTKLSIEGFAKCEGFDSFNSFKQFFTIQKELKEKGFFKGYLMLFEYIGEE